jgi:hypothetical protein
MGQIISSVDDHAGFIIYELPHFWPNTLYSVLNCLTVDVKGYSAFVVGCHSMKFGTKLPEGNWEGKDNF